MRYVLQIRSHLNKLIRHNRLNLSILLDSWVYSYTVRSLTDDGKKVETRRQITKREYIVSDSRSIPASAVCWPLSLRLKMLLSSADDAHSTIYKLRRCFVWKRRAFHVDIFQEPCSPSCRGLILLETYCEKGHKLSLPDFLQIDREVTDDQKYSMFNLSLKPQAND